MEHIHWCSRVTKVPSGRTLACPNTVLALVFFFSKSSLLKPFRKETVYPSARIVFLY